MHQLSQAKKLELRSRLEKAVRTERKITSQVLKLILEVAQAKLHLEWGFSSLFDYLVNGLNYSESAAYRRMQAARALGQIPELEQKIEQGLLNLSQIAQAQSAIKSEEKKKSVSLEKKRALFSQLENKNKRETDKILDQELSLPVKSCQEKHKKDDSVELTIRVSKEVYEMLQEMQSLYSHTNPNGDWAKTLELMAKEIKTKRTPKNERLFKKTTPPPLTLSNTDTDFHLYRSREKRFFAAIAA